MAFLFVLLGALFILWFWTRTQTVARMSIEDKSEFEVVEEGREVIPPKRMSDIGLFSTLLGFLGEKYYLIILENNTEMRPTGGFIGAFAVVRVKSGEVDVLWLDDSYNLDRYSIGKRTDIPPPKALGQSLDLDGWYFRDANWDADFAKTSKTLLEFYAQELSYVPNPPTTRTAFDGVIAFTPKVIERILEIIGGVQVEDKLYEAHNFTEELEYRVEYEYEKYGEGKRERKNVITLIGQALLSRLREIGTYEKIRIGKSFLASLKDKNILLFSKNGNIQRELESRNWAGRVLLNRPEQDYIFIVDANLASLKSDASLEREYEYHVTEQDGKLVSTLSLRYSHRGTYDWRTSRYRSATRVYLPKGVKIMSVSEILEGKERLLDSSQIEIYEEYEKNVVLFTVLLKPQEVYDIRLRYELPREISSFIANGMYSLKWQKQAGTQDHPVTVDIDTPFVLKSWNIELKEDILLDYVHQKNRN